MFRTSSCFILSHYSRNHDTFTCSQSSFACLRSGHAFTPALKRAGISAKALDSSRVDYANTQDSGQDIRFTDSDGTTLLSYEIEKWDETGSSYVWVKVPSVDINSSTDYIYVYYGNTGASDAQAATSVWDSNYKAIFHMKETSGITVGDSTSTALSGSKVGASNPAPTTSGYIGGAQDFNGTSDYIDVANGYTSTIQGLSNFTVDMWLKPTSAALSGSKVLLDAINCGSLCFGSQFNSSSGLYWWVGGSYRTYTGINFVADTWYHLSFVKTGSGNSGNLYVNGILQSTYTGSIASATNTNSTLRIGHYQSGTYYTGGIFDELRMSNTNRSAAWIVASHKSDTDAFNTYASQEARYVSSGTLTSNIIDTEQLSAWGTVSYTSSGSTVTLKARTSNDSGMSGATAFSSCNAITSGTDISSNNCVTDGHRYIQYQVSLSTADTTSSPTFSDISIGFGPYDTTAPPTNATSILMYTASGGRSISSSGWDNAASPYFSWTAGADNVGGSGIAGYCLYLGTDNAADPGTSKGLLGTSPVSTTGSTCQFIISGTSIDLSTSGYIGTALTSSTSSYYLLMKAIDYGNNIFAGSATSFAFKYDGTTPTNVSYTSCSSGNFSNVTDMSFSWPTSGGSASSDSHSTVLGWQYQINSSAGVWQGTTPNATLNLDYIPATASAYTLVQTRDASSISSGSNIVYFRTVDTAGNTSSDATVRTCNLSYGGAAPAFGGTDTVTITPSSATSNSFALSWPAATASGSNTVAKYYYMINTSPPSTLATLQGNASTYVDNGTTRTVSASSLSNVNKGTNTVYVVAIDNASTPNYSPSNYISGTFTLNSTDPDNPGNLVASDSSIKSSEQWNVTLTWTAPAYKGAGNITYLINRSSDGSTFAQVGTSSGLSYVDSAPSSAKYYYKVYAKDGANATSSGTNAVNITPTGKYTTAAGLSSGPTASSTTTKNVTITWSTDRKSDSKISYGTASGKYFDVVAANTDQVTSHSIKLTNLTAGTTYYYKAKWTDEDGNTGESSEKSLSTEAAPTVKDVAPKNISLSSIILEYTAKGASKVKIYYGTSTSFGGSKEVSTSTSETIYDTELTGLLDGTKYYYKINTFDIDTTEYEGTVLDFTTLPRPKIANVRVQQVLKTAQPTILVSWTTNTEVSSIVSYYPEGKESEVKDEITLSLIKGEHKVIIRNLSAQTPYFLIVKGRDKAGNEASSDSQKVTTATDTRPPQISDLKVEGSSKLSSSQESTSQLIVSWNTDEAGTSQVEFGEGTGSNYSQKTQEDSNLTSNHLVVISGLTPSKVYHLRALSKDKASNPGQSIDTVTITPKATENALNLVITNLQEAFGFLKGVGK